VRGGPRRGVPDETSLYGTERHEPPRDVGIAAVAKAQHGVVTLGQLQLAGLTASAVRNRVQTGRLHPIHRGVYAVGHDLLTSHGRVMAAVLAYGPAAVASHRAAAGIHRLRADNRAKVDISVPRGSVRQRQGIDAHASLTLRPQDMTTVDRIPCTTVARTLIDLADVVPRRQLERALEQAVVLRVFDLRELEDALARANGRRGVRVLRAALAELDDDPGITMSDAEDAFLELCRAAGLRQPEVNQWLEIDDGPPIRTDFLWRKERLIVEVDGWQFHRSRHRFEADRLRDQRVRLADWEPVRVTPRQILRDGDRVVRTVAALLAR
jgi:very-short-patch-repair endonuclease